MGNWGDRFAPVGSFISYCRELGVGTDQNELEYYEKTGTMLPVARVVYPNEYVIQRHQSLWSGHTDWCGADKWPTLERLIERIGDSPFDNLASTDEELVHCLDREMDAGDNPYLARPHSEDFRPWSDYRVIIQNGQGNDIRQPTAEHYYSYWQVHQLYWIQQFPDLYKNASLIERIPESDPVRNIRPWPPNKEGFADFGGKQHNFDALSFWITVYGRERNRTFASVPESNGVRRLTDVEAAAHRTKLIALASTVTKRYQLTRGDLYLFLRNLIKQVRDYEEKERYKLARSLKRDIFAWEDLLMLTTGETRDMVAEELGKVSIHDKREFRHLDISTKEHDYALKFLNHASEGCAKALNQLGDTQWSFAESDVNDLLSYCEQQGLGLFITALSGMVAVGDEESRRNFRRVQMYSNLKNMLNSYEYLLKAIWEGTGKISDKNTLTQLVDKLMVQETWHSLFKTKMIDPQTQQSLLRAGSASDFLANLATLMADNQLRASSQGYWAQKFLILCLARNMTVHSYPSEDSYYGDLFGPMRDAAITATFYTWRVAKRDRLV